MSNIFLNNLKRLPVVLRMSIRHYNEMPDKNKPVKFTTSDAAGWRAEYTRRGNNIYSDIPEAQTYIVSLSTFVFLFYFLYYREENDIDEKLNFSDNSLYDQVEGLEEVQLRIVKKFKLERGEDVTEVDLRLRKLETDRLTDLEK